jgi:hypothetical protein
MSDLTRDALLKLLKQCAPRTRKTVLRVLEGKASQDGVAFVQERMDFMEPDLTVRSVDLVVSRTCDSGHLQDQHTHLAAVCEQCGAITCSTPGCSLNCVRCARALCRRHAHVYADGDVYCRACRPLKWLRLFFDLDDRKKEDRR